MPFKGRLCDQFDRLVDEVQGPLSADNDDEAASEIWDEGPQSDMWKWIGDCSAAGSFGIDVDGAYFKTTGGSTGTAFVSEAQSVVIENPCRIYLATRCNGTGGTRLFDLWLGESGNTELYGEEGVAPAITAGVRFDQGYTFYDDAIVDTTVFTDFVPEIGTIYWMSLDYAPGEHISMRLWTGLWDDEPEDALKEMSKEDGYYIPEYIDDIQMTFSPGSDAGATIWVNQIGVEVYCPPDELPVVCTVPAIVNSTRFTSGTEPGTNSTGLTPTSGNLIICGIWKRDGWTTLPTPTGWTAIQASTGAFGFTDGLGAWAKQSDGTETSILLPDIPGGGTGLRLVFIELSGAQLGDLISNLTEVADGAASINNSITPTVGVATILIAFVDSGRDSGDFLWTESVGWTELYESVAGGHPQELVAIQEVNSPSGSYSITATQVHNAHRRLLMISASCQSVADL